MKNEKLNRKKLFKWAKDLFPLNRSLTGDGNKETLIYLKKIFSGIKIKKFNSGKKVNSWKIPLEWNIKQAYIENKKGKRILDFKKNNLHVVGYSLPIDKNLNYKQLSKKIYFLKQQPNAIPYVTSYYKKDWGFCMSYKEFKKIDSKEKFKIKIDSKHTKGNLIYGEAFIPGKSKKEILLTTNICHPSMANNELSGPIVLTALGSYLAKKKNNFFSYRILYLPETIGSIAYINQNKNKLKKNVVAGFVVVCVGDNKNWSLLSSPKGDTLADNVATYVLRTEKINYKKYNFFNDRGSDERQFCWPGVNLPVCSIMRSKYGTYKEYHTSLDNLKFISSIGLWSSFNIYKKVIKCLELNNTFYRNNYFGKSEPFLTKYKLIETLSRKSVYAKQKLMMQIAYLTTSKKTLVDLTILTGENLSKLKKIIKILIMKKFLRKIII